MRDYYVILTGSKNNAGDFLIKYRAKKLFSTLRPDRDVIDIDAWKPLDKQSLNVVNNSKALILMGGPALQERMHPRVYALTPNLDDITAPITTMGIGWSSSNGRWRDTYDYPLSTGTLQVLRKAQQSGLPLSVRDYHTLSALNFNGIHGTLMTGCPAYYDLDCMGRGCRAPEPPKKVAFSLGVSFQRSRAMDAAMKSQILELRQYFKNADFEVVFHHSLDKTSLAKVYSGRGKHSSWHGDFAIWLRAEGIAIQDISGSAEALVDYYSNVDLHIGYRVHAHIFMSSLSRSSILIAEDGRGKATERVIGGNVIEGFLDYRWSRSRKMMKKIGLNVDMYVANPCVTQDAINRYEYNLDSGGQTLHTTRLLIDNNFLTMKKYMSALP